MKRIIEIGVYKPGDLTSGVIDLDNVNANVNGNGAVFDNPKLRRRNTL